MYNHQLSKDVMALKEYFPTLTDYQALDIVTRMGLDQTLRAAFVVSGNDSAPSALEAIAMAMGQKSNRGR